VSTARLPHTRSGNDSQTRRRYNELTDQVTETIGSIASGNGDIGTLSTEVTALQQGPFNSGAFVSGTSPGTANTEFAIAHNLGRIPQGYFVGGVNPAGILYQLAATGTAWTTTNIYVKCTIVTMGFTVYIT
jgi:hypothetical protein